MAVAGRVSFRFCVLPRTTFLLFRRTLKGLRGERQRFISSSGVAYSSNDEIKSNPFYEKYAEKIRKARRELDEGRLENKSTEEKFQFDVTARSAAEKFKQKIQQKTAQSSLLGKNPLSTRGTESSYREKTLESLMHLDKIADKSPEEIGKIWREYHSNKDCISAVIPGYLFDRIDEQSSKYPLFIYPLPRDQGYEFMYAEFKETQCYFTSLLNYQTHREKVPWLLAIKHFTDLRQDKGIVLMVGEVDTNGMSVLDAQWLAYQVQMYYASEKQHREEILKTFNRFPDKFDHMMVVNELNSEIKSGALTGAMKH